VWQGLVSGAVGATVMSEKVEQRFTGRPDSFVPARVLQRLTGMADRPAGRSRAANWTMHLGQGALIGVLRSVMAHAGLWGPVASAMFAVVRPTNDQVLENATGVGAPRRPGRGLSSPWTCCTRRYSPPPPAWSPMRWRPVPVRVPGSGTPSATRSCARRRATAPRRPDDQRLRPSRRPPPLTIAGSSTSTRAAGQPGVRH
jgi:hypothetical protein